MPVYYISPESWLMAKRVLTITDNLPDGDQEEAIAELLEMWREEISEMATNAAAYR